MAELVFDQLLFGGEGDVIAAVAELLEPFKEIFAGHGVEGFFRDVRRRLRG